MVRIMRPRPQGTTRAKRPGSQCSSVTTMASEEGSTGWCGVGWGGGLHGLVGVGWGLVGGGLHGLVGVVWG
ncbi:hypothetical protein Pmani_034889 [Petrolisthes manimaculis]|uniref:Uncharacterized protein n=1 Tax=Petrolisthes manimaculis TaxID=1843537 RepID=A0AAE1NNF8_9EUCA|nr:hypothetical protein Pmani_034889 [Petrolisthes manimaculis]